MPQRLQIHDVPDGLMREIKKRAIDEDKHLKEWVVDALSGLIDYEMPVEDPFHGRSMEEQSEHDVVHHGKIVTAEKITDHKQHVQAGPKHALGCKCLSCRLKKISTE